VIFFYDDEHVRNCGNGVRAGVGGCGGRRRTAPAAATIQQAATKKQNKSPEIKPHRIKTPSNSGFRIAGVILSCMESDFPPLAEISKWNTGSELSRHVKLTWHSKKIPTLALQIVATF
jgi:hypothetical protein